MPRNYVKVAENKYKAIFYLEDASTMVPGVAKLAFYATGYDLPWGHPETLQVGDKIVKMNGSRAGSEFLQMFSYPIIAGNMLQRL